VIEWGKVPWSLWVYVGLTAGSIVVVVLTASVPVAPSIFSIVLILAWDFFLLKAIRWLWIATVVVGALELAFSLGTGAGTWYGYLLGLVDLALLLLPTTRRFFGMREALAAT
jgi:hypothetical protein